MANTLIGRLTPTNNMGGTLTNESRLTGQLGGVGAAVTYASLPDKPSINNVELVGNKTTSDLNISYNDLRDQPVIPDVGEIDERLDDLEGDITSLSGRVTTAEGDITSLGGRVTTAEGNITTLQGDTGALDTRLTTAEGDITSLSGRVTTAEGNITSLGGRLTTAEENITTLQGDTGALDTRLTTAEGNITSLGGRVTTAEGNITTLQGDMSQAQSDITQLNSSLSNISTYTTGKVTWFPANVNGNENICNWFKIGRLVIASLEFTPISGKIGNNIGICRGLPKPNFGKRYVYGINSQQMILDVSNDEGVLFWYFPTDTTTLRRIDITITYFTS